MPIDLHAVFENVLLDGWAAHLRRDPSQRNGVHEADAELVALPGGRELLAVTIDTVSEEIALGFYREPETAGWVAATAALSDLAAVGARPLGLVVAVTLPDERAADLQERLARGLDEACAQAGVFVLGGDTNAGAALSISCCAVGLVSADRVMRRVGCAPGHRVFVTGPLGSGAACAARAVFALPPHAGAKTAYRPQARVREGQVLAPFVSGCMDTSDGLVATLDQLARLNSVGMQLNTSPETLLGEAERALAKRLEIPAMAMLAAHHGEFELVFTVAPERSTALLAACEGAGLDCREIGEVTAALGLWIQGPPRLAINGARIRNLSFTHAHSPMNYVAALLTELGYPAFPYRHLPKVKP